MLAGKPPLPPPRILASVKVGALLAAQTADAGGFRPPDVHREWGPARRNPAGPEKKKDGAVACERAGDGGGEGGRTRGEAAKHGEQKTGREKTRKIEAGRQVLAMI